MKVKDWIDKNKDVFLQSDLQFLIKTLFDRDIFSAYLSDSAISADKLNSLERAKNLYAQGIPMGYVLGRDEFFGLDFFINRDVLIPRPDTEVIVSYAIKYAEKNKLNSILDLCCGSLNIAISIEKNLFNEKVNIYASDISDKALSVAQENIKKFRSSIKCINSDLFSGFKFNSFDLIVSNPPYVDPLDISGSLLYEPRRALEAGDQGLYFIKKILNQAYFYLKKNGYIILEMGYNQKERVEHFLQKHQYEIIEWIRDYGQNFRGVVLRVK